MNRSLQQGLGLVVHDFIDPARARDLGAQLREYLRRSTARPDGQCPDSPAVYNFVPLVELLLEKLPEMSARVEESLFPTFCYARSYVHGSKLDAHVDRPSSEVSATLNLDQDRPWPIYLGHRVKGVREVDLSPGQAVIYLGCETTHWREPFEGTSYEQVFLHYVRSRGKYASACFDNRTPQINGVRY